jgi:thiamine-phosphate pyrophosphorylase
MRKTSSSIRGLYAVTPDTVNTAWLCDRLESILGGGARLVQYRNKTGEPALRLEQARAVRRLTRSLGALLIINDSVELAAEVSADGVHLGRDDQAVAAARRLLGAEMLIGASCYNQLERAEDALAAGADYVAFGSAFPSPTKPAAVRASPALFVEAKRRLRCPVVAIGGIDPENAAGLVAAGVDALAVISALFDAPDPRAAATALARYYAEPPQGI